MRARVTGAAALASAPAAERRRLSVTGTVQGVGFRPFVWRAAHAEGLVGWVRNAGGTVEIEIEGTPDRLDAFCRAVREHAPPLARVDQLEARTVAPQGDADFRIRESRHAGRDVLHVSPDVATCAACLLEITTPAARRFRHPFTNCTDCGPRFTIIEALPYDRCRTTMRVFPLCAACRGEYTDPADRRFHAEPIACPHCGPRLEFRAAHAPRAGVATDVAADVVDSAAAAFDAAVAALRAGAIVALKGLGGYQLVCDATSAAAVQRLRARKRRAAKPFAVMVADVASARACCHVAAGEAELLASAAAPIVLLRARAAASRREPAIAAAVAPRLDTLGVMLPAAPLHHLLARAFGAPLVVTSGNVSEEPIAAANDEAERRLAGIADAFLHHDRAIASRYDDSVVRLDDGAPTLLRRARGYAPAPLGLSRAAPVPVLGAGAQLKSTFCLVRGTHAFVSQHLGDLDDALTRAHYLDTVALYCRLFGVEPAVIAHDMHPDYATTHIAASLGGARLVPVQHHHAHVMSCLAEHGSAERAIGVALDGSGYGTDGAVWGGELLIVDGAEFTRCAHLDYLALPGGDAAAREPWRMAVAALVHAFGGAADALAATLLPNVPASRRVPVLRLARGADHVRTSSAGRLFDAVAALLGVADRNAYEGEAALLLETLVDPAERGAYPLPLRTHDDSAPAVWDVAPLVRALVDDVRRGVRTGISAARFHNALAAALTDGCRRVRERHGIDIVALSGGCLQNQRLRAALHERLTRAGLRVLTHRRVPPNDGGISLGQAAVAIAALDA